MSQAPFVGAEMEYSLLLDPETTSPDDSLISASFDIMSFSGTDETSSWLYLEELIVDTFTISAVAQVLLHDFSGTYDGWDFAGAIASYDQPAVGYDSDRFRLSPSGSENCFSYLYSPDVTIQDNTVYRAQFEVGSSVTEPDDAVQIRCRVNQKGSWQAWDRVVNSNNQQGPYNVATKVYDVYFTPDVTGSGDNLAVIAFDIMSFSGVDDVNSWIYLESFTLDELTLTP
jgi:hypothetical protein